jgi:hypothetical protein
VPERTGDMGTIDFNQVKKLAKLCLAINVAIAILAATGCDPGANQALPPAQSVPSEYEQLYSDMSKKLNDFDIYLNSQWDGTGRNITFGAELLSANCHMGERLLTEENYRGVLVYLDSLQSMGIQGVKIAIDYPLLTPDFPNYDGYVKFYKRLAQECRARKMTMLVATGNLFVNSPFTDLKYSLSGLTLAKYRQGKRQMVETICKSDILFASSTVVSLRTKH